MDKQCTMFRLELNMNTTQSRASRAISCCCCCRCRRRRCLNVNAEITPDRDAMVIMDFIVFRVVPLTWWRARSLVRSRG